MNKAKLPTHVELDAERYKLVKNSVVLLEQVRTIDKKRLKEKVCHLDDEILKKVDRALSISLDWILIPGLSRYEAAFFLQRKILQAGFFFI